MNADTPGPGAYNTEKIIVRSSPGGTMESSIMSNDYERHNSSFGSIVPRFKNNRFEN